MTNKLLNFNHVRTSKQSELMKKIKTDRVCPFCWENFEKYHPKPVLKKGDWWLVTKNAFPYSGSRLHLLLVYRYHITTISKITPQASTELFMLLSWAEKNFYIKGGSVFIRFGETNRTGSSVEHLHAQLVVGNSKLNPRSESLKIKLGYYV